MKTENIKMKANLIINKLQYIQELKLNKILK